MVLFCCDERTWVAIISLAIFLYKIERTRQLTQIHESNLCRISESVEVCRMGFMSAV